MARWLLGEGSFFKITSDAASVTSRLIRFVGVLAGRTVNQVAFRPK